MKERLNQTFSGFLTCRREKLDISENKRPQIIVLLNDKLQTDTLSQQLDGLRLESISWQHLPILPTLGLVLELIPLMISSQPRAYSTTEGQRSVEAVRKPRARRGKIESHQEDDSMNVSDRLTEP
ncbi:MAG: hypothetical protein KatS3mg113_0564 [Planctomycetaceae bacterium]|nr:MAG: hypothetical protein KatS3mg113_0564 [Planctomycetaceae bacterium]